MIYIHVPFCKQLCYYCDFHFSLSLRFKDQMLAAMGKELDLRQNYLPNKTAHTVYFGGGTPSLLQLSDIEKLLNKVHQHYQLAANAEITLEANPDDLTKEYLLGLKQLGINRLSIGIQSFIDTELRLMNRRHTANEAFAAVENALEVGIDNLTVDLIYGLPNSTLSSWEFSLNKALALPIQHFSSYHLGFEEKTAFDNFRKKGKLKEVDEDNSWAQYRLLCERMRDQGYQHYEISNFALPNWRSRHNSAYWNAVPYLGIGPSAHSFDGKNRQSNVAHNRKYMDAIAQEGNFFEVEHLSKAEQFNDYLLTRLRTTEGLAFGFIQKHFPAYYTKFLAVYKKYKNSALIQQHTDRLALSEEGMFRSDAIIADFFVV